MRKIALVIGLEYSGNYKLNGCYNDALNIISTIKDLYGFVNNEILFINDKNGNSGSKKYIEYALNYVVDGNYDFVFFYYAGHGSTINDYDGDEKKLNSNFILDKNSLGKDSYLCSSEDNGSIGVVKDDTIKQILSKLKSHNTFLGLIDCCHSGTMFDCDYIYFPNKINGEKCKSNKMKYLFDNYHQEFDLLESSYENLSNRDIKGNVLLISAARDNQYSYESVQAGKNQGNFTYNACRLMKKCKYQDISIKQFVLTVCGMLDDKKQLTVCSSSYYYDLDHSYIYDKSHYTPYFLINQEQLNHVDYQEPIKEVKKSKFNTWEEFFNNIFRDKMKNDRSVSRKHTYLPYIVVTSLAYRYYQKNN